jgi:hypothetical protein
MQTAVLTFILTMLLTTMPIHAAWYSLLTHGLENLVKKSLMKEVTGVLTHPLIELEFLKSKL